MGYPNVALAVPRLCRAMADLAPEPDDNSSVSGQQ
jgi:hypothetical protein